MVKKIRARWARRRQGEGPAPPGPLEPVAASGEPEATEGLAEAVELDGKLLDGFAMKRTPLLTYTPAWFFSRA